MTVRVGTAGWTLPKLHANRFPASTEERKLSHLQRYAARLNCVEINSSFYRAHRLKTWQRWAASTPGDFRFAVKMPKAISHTAKLDRCGGLLQGFLCQIAGLGEKLGPLLLQLPPKLAADAGTAQEFFSTLRELHTGPVVCEPRHASWFTPEIDRLLRSFEIARAAADPPKGSDLAARPGGWAGLRYFRLHGAPRTYYSDYDRAALERLAATLERSRAESWVVFDNTALGHAVANALDLKDLIQDNLIKP